MVTSNGAAVPFANVGQAILVDPGTYRVTVDAPGFQGETKEVTVPERGSSDQVSELSFQLSPLTPVVVPPRPNSTAATQSNTVATPRHDTSAPLRHDTAPSPAADPRADTTNTTGYVIGGVRSRRTRG